MYNYSDNDNYYDTTLVIYIGVVITEKQKTKPAIKYFSARPMMPEKLSKWSVGV